MPEWIMPLLIAFGGAAVALIGREIIERLKSPKLIIDFERSKDKYPLTVDYNDESTKAIGVSFRTVFLRLNVRNKGQTTAYDCDAKIELIETRRKEHYRKLLHWSRRDPRLYKPSGLDKIFSPVNLNRNDEETVDVLQLRYSYSSTDPEPRPQTHIETVSHGILQLSSNILFFIKVTIYASNATSQPFCFKVNWDGTINGFDTAFKKLSAIPKEYTS